MFNKKLFVIFVFLLFILQISFVSAQSDNQTNLINKSVESTDYALDNYFSQNFESKVETDNCTDKMEFYQGDKIPIKINGPSDGQLKVLVDDMKYETWDFTMNEIIHIPTFNPKSFHDNNKINIDVGVHNISLIFNFENFISKDVNIFMDENSTLNFNFNNNYGSYITTYTYNFTLNILKKDKTIHILNLTFHNLCEKGFIYIDMDNLEINEDYNVLDVFGGIITNNNNEIISKESFGSWSLGGFIMWALSDVKEVGVYNFTVINLIDGTVDSALFKADKYEPKLNITYIIDGCNIKINISDPAFEYDALASITVDNITKMVHVYENDIGEVFFGNLSSGIHTLTIYCPEDSLSEKFYYTMSFEIEEYFDLDNINETNINQNSSDDKNLSFIIGNTTSGNTSNLGGSVKNHDDTKISYSKKNNLNFKKNIINSSIGEYKAIQSSSNTPIKKSYEIRKKVTSKKSNEITQLQLIVITFILLLIGYFKYNEKI